jgi:hypothetical protein
VLASRVIALRRPPGRIVLDWIYSGKARHRERIVETASRLFREKGVDGVGIDAIMGGAGRIHPLSTTVAADPWTGCPTYSTPAVFEKLLEVFEALRGEGGCRNVADAQDGKATVLGLHVHGDRFEAFHLFTEHSGNAGDCIDVTRRGHGHAAFAGEADLVQFQGSSSANREAGWSAMPASTSASQARGSTLFSLAVYAARRTMPNGLFFSRNGHDLGLIGSA